MTQSKTDLASQARDLRHTIDHGLVRALFQPIVDLERAEIRAFEVLTRTQPGSAFSNPAELFDAAESTGLLWELESLTRRTALRAAVDWPEGVLLFLNCTPQVFADERFAQTLLDEVDAIPGLSPRRIVLEVTERSENQHVTGLHRQALVLQQKGFHLAIDDVGAGASGLNRIMLLRPDWLKLDRELVDQIDRDPVKTNLVRFLTHFARLSGVTIIGEGVEREAELEHLARLGVHCAQGYLLGRPGDVSQQLSLELLERIRDQARGQRSRSFAGERCDRLARIVRPAACVSAETSVEDLRQTAGRAGVAVIRDGALIGWCPRERLDASPGAARAEDLALPCPRTLREGASIDEALEFASAAADASVPIIVTDTGRVVGTIDTAELLLAAAEACREIGHRTAPLTGLPGRVRCEQRLRHAMDRQQPVDAAFVDLRGLADYNAVFGFELGDELIRELADVIADVLHKASGPADDAFVGHLGDDRFFLLLPPGVLDATAERVIAEFQSRVWLRGISPTAALSGLGAASATATVAVRFLAVRDAAAFHDDAREVLRLEPTLRALADERAAMSPNSPGHVAIVDAGAAPSRLRLAA